jgi:hypothetical protein
MAQSYASSSRSLSDLQTPQVIPQAVWFMGLVFFVAVALLLLVRAAIAFVQGDLSDLFALIGSKSAVAEAEEEIRSAEHVLDRETKP